MLVNTAPPRFRWCSIVVSSCHFADKVNNDEGVNNGNVSVKAALVEFTAEVRAFAVDVTQNATACNKSSTKEEKDGINNNVTPTNLILRSCRLLCLW